MEPAEVVRSENNPRVVPISDNTMSRPLFEYSDVSLPNVTPRMLRRCMDEATQSVILSTSVEQLNNLHITAHYLCDSFITAIMKATSPSNDIINSKDNKVFEDPLFVNAGKEERVRDVSDVVSIQKGNATSSNTTVKETRHSRALTMDVPEFAVFCMRGVRCKICWLAMKGRDCVQRLIDHCKQCHPKEASTVLIENIRKENTYKKLLGKGLPYCTCSTCIRVGCGGWDERFNAGGRSIPKGNRRSMRVHK